MTLEWHGEEVKGKLREGAENALWEASGAWLTEANLTCPHDTGNLERSGVNRVDKSALEAIVGYAASYATEVHEADPSVNFRGKGRRKWLEKTGRENSDKYKQHIADVIEEAMS